MKVREKRKIPEKTLQSTASSGTIPTCEGPVARPGIEPGSPWWEASVLTAQPPCGPESCKWVPKTGRTVETSPQREQAELGARYLEERLGILSDKTSGAPAAARIVSYRTARSSLPVRFPRTEGSSFTCHALKFPNRFKGGRKRRTQESTITARQSAKGYSTHLAGPTAQRPAVGASTQSPWCGYVAPFTVRGTTELPGQPAAVLVRQPRPEAYPTLLLQLHKTIDQCFGRWLTRCKHRSIISHTCSTGEKSGYLTGQGMESTSWSLHYPLRRQTLLRLLSALILKRGPSENTDFTILLLNIDIPGTFDNVSKANGAVDTARKAREIAKLSQGVPILPCGSGLLSPREQAALQRRLSIPVPGIVPFGLRHSLASDSQTNPNHSQKRLYRSRSHPSKAKHQSVRIHGYPPTPRHLTELLHPYPSQYLFDGSIEDFVVIAAEEVDGTVASVDDCASLVAVDAGSDVGVTAEEVDGTIPIRNDGTELVEVDDAIHQTTQDPPIQEIYSEGRGDDEKTKEFPVLSPCPWNHLDHTTQHAYHLQTYEMHGLRWDEENIPYEGIPPMAGFAPYCSECTDRLKVQKCMCSNVRRSWRYRSARTCSTVWKLEPTMLVCGLKAYLMCVQRYV
ncbi:hypothetical protein PR048_019635 [Dryococelus australis]|uniref:Uncharacterized protein n=1 Tax=Dryococelus australis TaxID=614101 RepID=A0ABQ9H411_9NEOP|nr:hypothetical protein PR048_019635 [Dryococelus australis]